MGNWARDLETAIVSASKGDAELQTYVRANVDAVKQLLRGIGPDEITPSPGAGACIVFNISCRHVPGFCEDSSPPKGNAYKNTYDLGKAGKKRQLVDVALEAACRARGLSVTKEKMYFAALETTGTGIRFFGDFCMVIGLRPDWAADGAALTEDQKMVVLERNSYDLVRAPIVKAIDFSSTPAAERERYASEWAGSWAEDLIDMVALRVLHALPKVARLWTSGEISRVILDDEDYSEVLYPRSFDAGELVEVRVTAMDAAAEGDIADRERSGEAPGLHELEWRRQRRDARRALATASIPIRVITTPGRVRSS
jgi:hypothetical protein